MSTIKVGSLVRFPSESARDEALNNVGFTYVGGIALQDLPITAIFKVTDINNTACRIAPVNCKKPIERQGGNWTYAPYLVAVNPSPIL